jgi:hypothetical protein
VASALVRIGDKIHLDSPLILSSVPRTRGIVHGGHDILCGRGQLAGRGTAVVQAQPSGELTWSNPAG